jgi:hypothetical protein
LEYCTKKIWQPCPALRFLWFIGISDSDGEDKNRLLPEKQLRVGKDSALSLT